MKIAHVSDTHIHNLRYHHEFREVFEELFQTLRMENVDYIVHTGDIVHGKTVISPELVRLTGYFLNELGKIAPLYVLLGNHDGLVKNKSRDNAISSIVSNLDNNSIYVFDGSETVEVGDNLTLTSFSIFESKDNWILNPENNDRVNIALYHGSVGRELDGNLMYDNGHVMSSDDVLSIDTFSEYDYTMLGHIHTCQELNEDGTIAYAGSTVQTNFGESQEKGFYIWNIDSDTEFSKEFIALNNPHPFVTLDVDVKKPTFVKNLKAGKYNLPEGCRLRLVIKNDDVGYRDVEDMFRAVKREMKVHSTQWIRKRVSKVNTSKDSNSKSLSISLDMETQNSLIKDNLQNRLNMKDDQLIADIVKLNQDYFNDEERREDTELNRNSVWELKSMAWNNLFSYGENNEFDFAKYDDGEVVGIFGSNRSGKSSIIDTLLFGLFGKTSKKVGPNSNIINKRRNGGDVVVELEIDGVTYIVDRRLKRAINKYNKDGSLKIKDPKNPRANLSNSSVEFYTVDNNGVMDTNLIDTTRFSSDHVIQSRIGDLDDFTLGSLSTQFNSLQFVDNTKSERRDILKRVLNLDVLDDRYERALSEFNYIKKKLKRESKGGYTKLIKKAKSNIEVSTAKLEDEKTRLVNIKEEISQLRDMIKTQEYVVIDFERNGVEDIDIESEKHEFNKFKSYLKSTMDEIVALESSIVESKDRIERGDDLLSTFDREEYEGRISEIENMETDISEKESSIEILLADIKRDNTQLETGADVPCRGTDYFYNCNYIHEAVEIMKGLDEKKDNRERLQEDIKTLREDLEGRLGTRDEYNKFIKVSDVIKTERQKLQLLKSNLEKKILFKTDVERKLKQCEENMTSYNNSKVKIDNYQNTKNTLEKIKQDLIRRERESQDVNDDIISDSKELGVLENVPTELEGKLQEKINLEYRYDLYEAYTKTIGGKTGISFDILKQYIPVINREIESVLKGIVGFIVYFQVSDSGSIEIRIADSHGDTPIETGSGMEKQMASIAIRLAIVNITSVPHSNVFLLDEPMGALDDNALQDFVKILEVLKHKFDTVFLITHNILLKDVVDRVIDVERDEDDISIIRE